MCNMYTVEFQRELAQFWVLFDANIPAFLSHSLSGPAVRYNPEFNKRIPVTGLGGLDLTVNDNNNGEPLSILG